MSIKKNATANWTGTGSDGKGTLSTANKFFNNTPYSFKSRFQNEDGTLGTNPEELIAAAHAGCFTMALSFAIAQAGFVADNLNTKATVTLDEVEGGFEISGISLFLTGSVSGMDIDKFTALANSAKAGCPVSKALSAVPISLEIKFV